MRIAFLGTPDVAVPSLEALAEAEDVEVEVVITNPDRPRGRSSRPVAPPIKVAALAAGLDVWQPAKPIGVVEELRQLDLDVAAVVAYGSLLPTDVLTATRHGFVNLHFSLLPRWRGAAPVQHALRAGDRTTGVTTFVIDEGMDTGPVLDQVEVPIEPEETAGELLARLSRLGAPALVDSLRRLVGGAQPRPQPREGVTLAPRISPGDVAIDWGATAQDVVNLIRSANPSPGAHTTFRGKRHRILRAVPVEGPAGAGDAGTVLRNDREGPVVAVGDGAVRLESLQPEGRSAVEGTAFVNGYRPEPGERLGGSSGVSDPDAG